VIVISVIVFQSGPLSTSWLDLAEFVDIVVNVDDTAMVRNRPVEQTGRSNANPARLALASRNLRGAHSW
jgi:hypothetical protein